MQAETRPAMPATRLEDEPYDPTQLKDKTILITGGASGLGAAFAIRFAELGANIIIGDLADGVPLVTHLRELSGHANHHYIHADTTSWDSQVALFQSALQLSPTKSIHHVLANAGVNEQAQPFNALPELGAEFPPAPPPAPVLTTLNVNLIGQLYTTRLALHYLRLVPADQHPSIIITGSVASFVDGTPLLTMYLTSKHGMLGFFRALRNDVAANGIRLNMLCPYFVNTPFLGRKGGFWLAGIEKTELEEVVRCAERMLCERRGGRCMLAAPKSGGGCVEVDAAHERELEEFSNRMVRLMRKVEGVRKMAMYVRDLWAVAGGYGYAAVGAVVLMLARMVGII